MKALARELGLPEMGAAGIVCVATLFAAVCVPTRFGDEAIAAVFLVGLVAWTLSSRECPLIWALSFFSYYAIRSHQPHFLDSVASSVTPVFFVRIAHGILAVLR